MANFGISFLKTAIILISLSHLVTIIGKSKYMNEYPWSPLLSSEDKAAGRSLDSDLYREGGPDMDPTSLGFHRNCDGQCFFYPEDCDRATLSCSMITSIVELVPECESPTMTGDRVLCNKNTKYYTVSLLLIIETHYCDTFDKTKVRRCLDREFVAVSFFDDDVASVNDKDIWYVCTSGERSVTTWTNFATPAPYQITNTLPYPSKGAGVIWSEIKQSIADKTLVCRFILSTSQMHLYFEAKNATINVPIPAATHNLRVKMAQGLVERDETTGELLYPIISEALANQHNKYYAFPNSIKTTRIQSRIRQVPEETNTDRTISQKLDNMFLACKNNENKICYRPTGNSSCLESKSCPVLVLIHRPQEKTLKFIMVVTPKIELGIVEDVKPNDWASIGFVNGHEKDQSNGGITFNCMAKKSEANVVTGYNLEKVNNVISGPFQPELSNKEFLIEPEGRRFMCIWTVPTLMTFNLKRAELWYRKLDDNDNDNDDDYSKPKYLLNLAFNDNNDVMMAAGRKFYLEDWSITNHYYREFLTGPFSATKLRINPNLDLMSTGCKVINSLLLSMLTCILQAIMLNT